MKKQAFSPLEYQRSHLVLCVTQVTHSLVSSVLQRLSQWMTSGTGSSAFPVSGSRKESMTKCSKCGADMLPGFHLSTWCAAECDLGNSLPAAQKSTQGYRYYTWSTKSRTEAPGHVGWSPAWAFEEHAHAAKSQLRWVTNEHIVVGLTGNIESAEVHPTLPNAVNLWGSNLVSHALE